MSEDSTTGTSGATPPERADLGSDSPTRAASGKEGPSLASASAAAPHERIAHHLNVGGVFAPEMRSTSAQEPASSDDPIGRRVLRRHKGLQDQIGSDYGRLRDFRSNVVTQLENVIRVYPTVRVSQAESGLRLNASPPHVHSRP